MLFFIWQDNMIGGPLVSIPIPVFNREKLIGKTIESATSKTYEKIYILLQRFVEQKSIKQNQKILARNLRGKKDEYTDSFYMHTNLQ